MSKTAENCPQEKRACTGLAAVIHHSPRSGKTLVALAAILGHRLPSRWTLLPHQREALELLTKRGVASWSRPPRVTMMVFSSLVVIDQFRRDWLVGVDGSVRVLVACSLRGKQEKPGEDASLVLQACERTTCPRQLAGALQAATDGAPLLVLTTYQSAQQVDAALRGSETPLDLAVFDEAHNVHTPSRHFLYGGRQDSGGGAPTEEGLAELALQYPKRLYLTGTPREAMRRYPEVYGDKEASWHRYSYAQLRREQDPAKPVVKPFDVCILVNGRPAGAAEDPEFYDCLAVLREIAQSGGAITRVKIYHRRAHRSGVSKEAASAAASSLDGASDTLDSDVSGGEDEEENEDEPQDERRSAEFFGANLDLWQRALRYLHDRGEAGGLGWESLRLAYVHGSMPQAEVRRRLDDFNSADDDDSDRVVRILCSCQVFKEGVTLERCHLTVYADGKRSPRDIVQSGMRGLKAEPGCPEARLRVLLLVNLDGLQLERGASAERTSECIRTALQERSKMETVAAVLSSLKEENDELAEEIARLAVSCKSRDSCRSGDSYRNGGSATGDSQEQVGSSRQPSDASSVADGSDGDPTNEPSDAYIEKIAVGRTRPLSAKVAPELFQWELGVGEYTGLARDVMASVVIQLSDLSLVKEVVRWKVRVLCELCKEDAQVPMYGVHANVPKWLQKDAPLCRVLTAETAKTLDIGSFLYRSFNNWSVSGDNNRINPNTKLHEEDKRHIEKLPFFATWRAGDYAVVQWKVRVLCELCKENVPVPTQGIQENVPGWLQKEAPMRNGFTVEKAKTIDLGQFLNRIFHNWPVHGGDNQKRPNTALREEDKRSIEELPFFDTWRAGVYAVVRWKVRVLCELYKESARAPTQGVKLDVPERLQKKAPLRMGLTSEKAKTINLGNFLNSVFHNWPVHEGNNHKRPHTALSEEDKRSIEKLPFFDTWRAGDYAVTRWKVQVLCELYKKSRQVPLRGVQEKVPEWLQKEAPLRSGLSSKKAKTLEIGLFLKSIRHNWELSKDVADSKNPNTLLREEDKRRIEQLPFFADWRAEDYAVTQWKVRVLCELYKENSQVPLYGKQANVPQWLQKEAPLRNGLTSEKAKTIDLGSFLYRILLNWPMLGSEKYTRPNTMLNEEDKQRIEELPFFSAWRAGDYAVTQWKVRVLCELYKESARAPTQGVKLDVPERLQKKAPLRMGLTSDKAKTIDLGKVLNRIFHNWPVHGGDNHKRPNTALSEEDKRSIEELPFFETWRAGDYAVLQWKVRVLCVLYKESAQVPRQGVKLDVPDWLQKEAPLRNGLVAEKAKAIDLGSFLYSICGNWPITGGGKQVKPHTMLREEEKRSVESLPCFDSWRSRVQAFEETSTRPKAKRAKVVVHDEQQGDLHGAARAADAPSASTSSTTTGTPAPTEESAPPSPAEEAAKRKRPRKAQASSLSSTTRKRSRTTKQIRPSSESLQEEARRLCERFGVPLEDDPFLSRRPSSKGYDPSAFDSIHHRFKDLVNWQFRELAAPESKHLYLDSWADGDQTSLRTTEALLSKIPAPQLFCANPDAEIARCLRDRYGVNAFQGSLEEALAPGTGAFARQAFYAAYLDLCTGTAAVILRNLEALRDCMRPDAVLCYTMTGRDPHGESMTARYSAVHLFLASMDFHPLVSERPEQKHMHELRTPKTSVLTAFYQRVCI